MTATLTPRPASPPSPSPADASRADVNFGRRMRADVRGAYIIWYRDVLRYFRDRTRIVAGLGQPVLYLFIFGTGLSSSFAIGQAAGGAAGALNYRTFMFPGVLAMTVIFTSIMSAMSIVW